LEGLELSGARLVGWFCSSAKKMWNDERVVMAKQGRWEAVIMLNTTREREREKEIERECVLKRER